jgi:hypothetical protein
MRNHEPFIAMRRAGQKPPMVQVRAQQAPRRVPAWSLDALDCIFVEPEDTIARLDLRFLVGCVVLLTGEDAERVRDLFGAIQDHGAARVIGHVTRPVPERETVDLIEILDTEGILTWHA